MHSRALQFYGRPTETIELNISMFFFNFIDSILRSCICTARPARMFRHGCLNPWKTGT